jgi:hypothetical protein
MPDSPQVRSALRTTRVFLRKGTCSETLFHVLDRAAGQPWPEEERACAPMAGGVLQHGFQCGQVWGAVLAAGARAHARFGPGPLAQAHAMRAAQRLVEAFRAQNRHRDCLPLTGLRPNATALQMVHTFLVKGVFFKCLRMASRYAPLAHAVIEASLTEPLPEPSALPLSCTALLAERMGASEVQVVMAAGLAGGIGLSGGACGALGAAIWLTTLRHPPAAQTVRPSPEAERILERFQRCTDREFACPALVGRTFTGPRDHAEFLKAGGCARILEALAAD